MTVGELLETIRARVTIDAAPAVDTATVLDLRDHLAEMVAEPLGELRRHEPDALVRMPKGRIAELGTCQRLAVATAAASERGERTPVTDTLLVGIAADRFVAHQLLRGRVLEPLAVLRSMLDTEGEDESVAALDGYDAEHMAALLDPLAAAVANGWHDVGRGWAPRVQSAAVVTFADSAAVTRGVIDVELGGPSTGLPTVLVEVKSSAPRTGHPAETYLYALLVALRDRHAPAAVARWYPTGEPAELRVSEGVLESAALALGRAIHTWVDLRLGAAPAETPGPACRWCPDAAVCPSAAPRFDAPVGDVAQDGPAEPGAAT